MDKDRLMREFEYDPTTGNVCSRITLQPVGSINKDGHVIVSTQGRKIPAHRLAFIFMGKKLPEAVIHLDGVKHNNRWANLKGATATRAQILGGRRNAAKYK